LYVDSSITFEDYHYWAGISRNEERSFAAVNAGLGGVWKMMLGKSNETKYISGTTASEPAAVPSTAIDEKDLSDTDKAGEKGSPPDYSAATESRYGITDTEWDRAQRALRNATWGSVFYLITTDILGPYSVPWAISRMGYGPGFALYTVFGGMAFYSGIQLWQQFLGLDSTRYPMRSYGDLAFRVYGKYAKAGVNILQSFQFFLNVALLIESNGQGLAQMAVGPSGTGFLCFVVAEVIFMLLGFLLGQIRTLQRLSFLANIAIWLNVIVIIMTMVVTAKYPPNYSAVYNSYGIKEGEPIITTANWPPNTALEDRINGLMNGVFSFGGATLFNELMAEMRRPIDFWKGFLCAEIFIYSVYIIMGFVVYSNQGQYTYNIAYEGIPSDGGAYAWQTLGNAVSFVSGLIAALLYGNIGVKVFYAAVLRDVFKFPPLNVRSGKIVWVFFIPIYWGLAFIIAAAIPQIANLTAFVGAACILQFSYTFPPILKVGYNCQKDAMLPEEEFDPATGIARRVDGGMSRWIRGYRKKFWWNTFDVVYFLGALATAGLGIYAAVISMHQSFSTGTITSFTCQNPAG